MQTGLDAAVAPTAQAAKQLLAAVGGTFWGVYIGGLRNGGSGWNPALIAQYAAAGIGSFLPLYVGPQILPNQGIDDSALLTADRGHTDGQQALSILHDYGWAAGSPCAADIEAGTSDALPQGAIAYIDGFSVALRQGGYVPGVYCMTRFATLLVGQTNRPSFVHIASWFSNGVDHSKDPSVIPGLDNGAWVQARIWQYAGDLTLEGQGVDIDVANLPLAPAPGHAVARHGHLVDRCALKFEPNHGPDVVVEADKNAAVAVLPWTATTNNEVWQRVQCGDHEGWVLANNVRVP